MVRIGSKALTAAFAAFLAICLVLVSVSSEAGEKRRKFRGNQSGSIAHSVGPHVSGQRSRHRQYSANKGGWDKGWNRSWNKSRNWAWNDARHAGNRRYWKHGQWQAWNGRYRDNDWSNPGSVSVSVGDQYSAETSGPVIVDAGCEAGQYCTIRLGPYSNSPKIITLSPGIAEPIK